MASANPSDPSLVLLADLPSRLEQAVGDFTAELLNAGGADIKRVKSVITDLQFTSKRKVMKHLPASLNPLLSALEEFSKARSINSAQNDWLGQARGDVQQFAAEFT